MQYALNSNNTKMENLKKRNVKQKYTEVGTQESEEPQPEI
jgi:hypothetical protein